MTADLLARLEAATEGSRELDAELARLVAWKPVIWGQDLPHYTTSIDAALTLVPEGWDGLISWWRGAGDGNSYGRAELETVDGDRIIEVETNKPARSAALALCIAALKAREADQ